MSRSVEIVMSAGALPALAGGMGALALGVGGAAYAAYALVKQLHDDYKDGLQEFHQQANLDAQLRKTLTEQERAKLDEARALISHTKLISSTDADALFLQHQVQQLQQRLSRQSDVVEFTQQCDALLEEMSGTPERFQIHLEAYRRLADAAGAAAEKRQTSENTLPEEIAVLRDEILSPLLNAPELVEVRQQLLDRLDALQTLSIRQRTLARQGLSMLRQRVYREIQMQAKRRQVLTEQAEERRYLISDIFAKTRAIMRLPDMLDVVQQAQALNERVGQALIQSSDDELASLRQLAEEAGKLFASLEETLQHQLVSAYLSDEVNDVLLSLGYQVNSVAGEGDLHRFITPVDADHGIEFHIDGQGRMGTEMVALTPGASITDPAAEEKICHIVDEVIAHLKVSHHGVRERFRTSLKPEEELRVVEIDADDPEKLRIIVTPKEKRIDES